MATTIEYLSMVTKDKNNNGNAYRRLILAQKLINYEENSSRRRLQAAGIFFLFIVKTAIMRDWLRTLIAGYGAYKWGGGCLGTIVVFFIIYWLLGYAHC